MTMITNHLSASNGNDLTMKAAINTARIDGIAIPIAALRLYAPILINRIEAGGIKKAQDPIMIGKATCGDNPKAYTRAIHGAYNPMPAVIKAPKIKLTITAMASLPLLNPIALPPP